MQILSMLVLRTSFAVLNTIFGVYSSSCLISPSLVKMLLQPYFLTRGPPGYAENNTPNLTRNHTPLGNTHQFNLERYIARHQIHNQPPAANLRRNTTHTVRRYICVYWPRRLEFHFTCVRIETFFSSLFIQSFES